MPHYTEKDFISFIEAALSAKGKVQSEYDDARDYFEDEQAPSNIPTGKEYVVVNRGNDLVRRRTGEVISGSIKPVLEGGGKLARSVRYLFNDILDENNFRELAFPQAVNFFYNEGLSGFLFVDNPEKKSKYGIGAPEIYYLRPDEILLDPDARDGMHTDDRFRIHSKRITLTYAKERWPEHADKITASLDLTQGVIDSEQTNTLYCDLYTIEYRENVFREENGRRIEEEIYYVARLVNKIVLLEGPKPTGYPVFRIIPMIHTPRIRNKGKYPFGIQKLTRNIQDQLNVVESIILDWAKASVKMFLILRGVSIEEENTVRNEASKNLGVASLRDANARVEVITAPPIPAPLLEFSERRNLHFDIVSGSYAPERGAVTGSGLSGKAISKLQTAGTVPEYTAKANIEYPMSHLGVCIFTYISRMKQPFSIFPSIDGKETEIRFNAIAGAGYQGDELHIYHGGAIPGANVNVLRLLQIRRVKIEVELNVLQKEEIETNKALLLQERGALSLMDVLKVLYPNDWEEKLENVANENKIMALVKEMNEIAPEYVQVIAEQWQQIKPQLIKQQKELELQGRRIAPR